MKTSIYHLSYDFIQENGHYMVFSKFMQRPLENNDLVTLHMKMIQSNAIPHLLPLRVEEMDFQVRLLYEIPSKRMLSLFLRENNLSMKDYYALFLNIISVLEDSQLYMLDRQNYILLEDFLFVGKDVHDIYLTYLPIREIPEKGSMIDDLKELLLNVASEIQELDGKAFKIILNYVKSSNFSLAGLKEQLRELQSQLQAPRVQEQIASQNSSRDKGFSTSVDFSEPDSRPLWIHEVVEKQNDSGQEKHFEENEPSGLSEKAVLPPLTQREKIFMFVFMFISLALIWKLYESYSNAAILYTSGGLSMLVMLAAFVFWKFWRPGIATEVEERGAVFGRDMSVNQQAEVVLPQYEKPKRSKENSVVIQQRKPSPSNVKQYYNRLEEKTTLLSRSDDTVMLDEEVQSPSSLPYLTIKRDGEVEKINIQKQPFIIGRNPSGVHYIENSDGVSRAHLEIVEEDDGFAARDLGSKNGSFLNEQSMVAFKMYPLKENDQLTIGKVHFTFYMGSRH